MPRTQHDTPDAAEADRREREARRADLRAAALADRHSRAADAGHDPGQYDGMSVAELEQLAQDRGREADALKLERTAIRVALDRALNRESARVKLANLTPEEIEAAGGAVVNADALRGAVKSNPARGE